MAKDKTPFPLLPLLLQDVPGATSLYLAAFASNPHSLTCFPRSSPSTRSWWESLIASELSEPGAHWLKAVHPDTEEMVAFAKWGAPKPGELPGLEMPEAWPEGADVRVCVETFGAWAGEHRRVMGGRGHWYLEIVATHPDYQGQGAGTQLLRWGLERADADGVEAYLEGAPEAVPLYERFGFREVGRTETWIQNERVAEGVLYVNLYMLRPGKGKGSAGVDGEGTAKTI